MKTGYQNLRFMRAISVTLGIAVFLAACAGTNTPTPTTPSASIISPIPTSPVSNISPLPTPPVNVGSPQPIPVFTYSVRNAYPHDRTAFTEGLVVDGSALYESTGLNGQSTLRRVDLASGKVLHSQPLSSEYFGEGITVWNDHIIQLTWQTHVGFVYDKTSFELLKTFNYPTEGWGLTHDDQRLIMSDGTATLHFLNPDTLQETGRITVTAEGRPVVKLNELEVIHGEIWANIWQTDRIARIAPATGQVMGWIDLTGLLGPTDRQPPVDVLNGIAYDAEHDRLFVTGKLWPKLFEITLAPRLSPTESASTTPASSNPDAARSVAASALDFTLTDQYGQAFRLSDQLGYGVVLFFGYTHCPDVCPTNLTIWSRVEADLGSDAKQVRFVFITVDPERDTPDALRQYLATFSPNFIGLTGSTEALDKVYRTFGVVHQKTAAPGSTIGYAVAHSTDTYLIDPAGHRDATLSFGMTEQDTLQAIRRVLK
jgi:glutamine cyclotransferase/peroxiredoxin